MKKILNNISIFVVLLAAFFIPGKSRASSKITVSNRVNKIRSKLNNEVKNGTLLDFKGEDFANKSLKGWGNWGNWNNWNNWKNWNNWANWANWGNY